MKKYKTIIIGAGPAGLECAKVFAENNENFILFEGKSKFDRKICTGLWPLTDRTKHVNLPDTIFEKKFRKIIFSNPNKKIEVKLKKPFVGVFNRKKLSGFMFKQAKKAGANIVFNSPVSKIGKNYVVIKNKKVYFDNLIGADGCFSIVRKDLGLVTEHGIGIQYWSKQKLKNLEIHFDENKFGPWYGWIVPHKKLTAIGTGGYPKIIPSGKLKKNLDEWCLERGINVSKLKLEGGPLNWNYKGYTFNNKFLIGDAGGFVSTLTGGGIHAAIASGEDVAKMIIDENHEPNLINSVLRLKRAHDAYTHTMTLNKILSKIGHNLILFAMENNFLGEWALNKVLY